LRIGADDTLSDRDDINVEWTPSDREANWTETTRGPASTATVSWSASGLHNISVVAYDDDGAQSMIQTAKVNILNVPPTITGLGSDVPVFEDANVSFTAIVDDTASDLQTLVVCWDMDAAVDSNSDGNPVNDCDQTGIDITAAWTTRGVRQITATVTDDDGAQALASVNVSVLNLPPSATITNSTSVISLMEGENITLSGMTSRETEGDKLTLTYQWDSDHIDGDLDGVKTGDVDFTGPMYTIEDLPAGQWTVQLTVIDDDGESSTDTIQLTVTERPPDNWIESVSNTIGTVPTAIIGALGIIVVLRNHWTTQLLHLNKTSMHRPPMHRQLQPKNRRLLPLKLTHPHQHQRKIHSLLWWTQRQHLPLLLLHLCKPGRHCLQLDSPKDGQWNNGATMALNTCLPNRANRLQFNR